MKTKLTAAVRLAGLAVAVALFTAVASAQEKGAARLTQLNAYKATPVATVPILKPMSCANCQDRFVNVPDTETRGAGAKALVTGGPPTRIVAKHLCGACSNEWVVKGHGKAATSVPVHKCASCG
jgi:hypothetical protein